MHITELQLHNTAMCSASGGRPIGNETGGVVVSDKCRENRCLPAWSDSISVFVTSHSL